MSDFFYWWPAVLVPAGWIMVCLIISRVGGWALLAKVYLEQNSITLNGEICKFQSIQMRWATNYGNCVAIRAHPMGLGLSLIWLLRIGHPPLLIPWSDITIRRIRRSRFFPSLVEFRFRLEPSIPVRISNKLSLKIFDSSDKYYPEFRRMSTQLGSASSDEVPKTAHF